MAVPGADDVMLGYQSTSYHDVMYVRNVTGKQPAPEFEQWLQRMNILDKNTLVGLNQHKLIEDTLNRSLNYKA